MSLPHALLTALIERPCAGSELAGRFDRSIGYFWQATHQQIYRELARLEAAGWIEGKAVDGARGRKRTYRVLPAGSAELARWTAESQVPLPIRDEMMVRLRADAVIGPTALPDNLAELARHHRDRLQTYQAIEKRDFTPPPTDRAQQLRHLVLKAGIEYERHRAAFCEQALALLSPPPD
ncbi:PadR family transcriptional regulator [Niveispirillum sp.]|uniref:PadR family transcriptional regulator n=1 Tax=Niveispirillum sp. TaxID=1917217 RepID=UPI001B730B0C|nr:PadR family transcriptional regulator [Niveispirillum sp.]MBP7338274.1 PadR family transcriptional regulator [Niveispirillum sp.]